MRQLQNYWLPTSSVNLHVLHCISCTKRKLDRIAFGMTTSRCLPCFDWPTSMSRCSEPMMHTTKDSGSTSIDYEAILFPSHQTDSLWDNILTGGGESTVILGLDSSLQVWMEGRVSNIKWVYFGDKLFVQVRLLQQWFIDWPHDSKTYQSRGVPSNLLPIQKTASVLYLQGAR